MLFSHRNEELVTRLKHEIQKLKRSVDQPDLTAGEEDTPEMAKLKVSHESYPAIWPKCQQCRPVSLKRIEDICREKIIIVSCIVGHNQCFLLMWVCCMCVYGVLIGGTAGAGE